MKMRSFFALAMLIIMCLDSCTGVKNDEPLYVYAVGFDKDGAGVKLYALAGNESGGGTDGKSGGGKESGGEANTPAASIVTTEGANIENAFSDFFGQYPDVYTGTVKKYVVGTGFDDKSIRELEIFLASTGKLPVKRDIEKHDNPYGYLEENLPELVKN